MPSLSLQRRAREAVVCLAFLVTGCHAMPFLVTGCHLQPVPRDSTLATIESYVRSFRRAEPILLESLSRSDPRFARRLGIAAPSTFADPFSFDVRSIGIENIVLGLARVTLPEWTAGPEPRALVEHRLEEELLYRVVLEEQFRLGRERDDVRAAAGLFRAIAQTWPSAQLASADGARAMDGVLAWRLAQTRGAMKPYSLSEAEQSELRDAVEALDARVDERKLPRTRVEIVRLRATVATTWAAPFANDEWGDVATWLHAYVGVSGDFDRLMARIEHAAETFRAQAEVGLGVIASAYANEVRRRSATMLHATASCRGGSTDSVVRSLAPPPERAPTCVMVQSVATAESDLDELAMLVLLHDTAIVGAWSLALHGKVRDPAKAREQYKLMAPPSADREARLLRFASAHPEEAIGAAIAAAILARDGVAHVVATARAWRAFGDAPLDIVERELFDAPHPRTTRRPDDSFNFTPDAPPPRAP